MIIDCAHYEDGRRHDEAAMSLADAAANCVGSRLAALTAAMPIVAVPRIRRRSWSIASVAFLLVMRSSGSLFWVALAVFVVV